MGTLFQLLSPHSVKTKAGEGTSWTEQLSKMIPSVSQGSSELVF